MIKRLNDYKIENRKTRSSSAVQIVPISFENNEATKRIVIHSAKRVIHQHKAEIQALAYK